MPSYNQDYHYGKSKEPFVINHLAKYFKQTIVPNSNRFALFDAESETTLYEIKSRRCCKNTYPTTIVPLNKLCVKTNKKICFVFYFCDEICYIHYNKDLFDTFETRMITYFRSGIDNVGVNHICIPVELLKPLLVS